MASKTQQMVQNGITSAHNKTWPLYQRQVFSVEVLGSIDASDFESAELLQRELHDLVSRYGLKVTVTPVLVLEMSPEDQAEKHSLDDKAAKKAGYA